MKDIDSDAVKIYEECESVMMKISLPSELDKWECITCGMIEWHTEPVESHTGGPYETVTVTVDFRRCTPLSS